MSKLLFVNILTLLFLALITTSCTEDDQSGTLECLLGNINIDMEEKVIDIRQKNEWTDSTALAIVTYHRIPLVMPIQSTLKGKYKGKDIYFLNSCLTGRCDKEYKMISNNIHWDTLPNVSNDFIAPTYNPINIQIDYNHNKNCFGEVIRGKKEVNKDFACKCD